MTGTSAPESPIRTYRGNCHCAAFIYTLTVPEITSLSSCNCSYCSKRGVLWHTIPEPETQFQVVKGSEDDLAVYQFGSGQFLHKVWLHDTSEWVKLLTGGLLIVLQDLRIEAVYTMAEWP